MTLAIIGDCDTCKGEGKIAREDAGETRACFGCNGFGKRKDGGWGGAYKSQEMADRHGRTCRSCNGFGTWTAPDADNCHHCFYNVGRDVAVAHAGDTLPVTIGHCSSVPRDIATALVSEWDIIPIRVDRGMTWGESYLGLGSIYSVTDYGAAWSQTDAEVIARVKESLTDASSLQWTKIMNSDRVITRTIAVKITRGGYNVIGSMDTPMPALPPTYTPAVLNREI
jgi:RecJ-like exonuclease